MTSLTALCVYWLIYVAEMHADMRLHAKVGMHVHNVMCADVSLHNAVSSVLLSQGSDDGPAIVCSAWLTVQKTQGMYL